jgi:NADH:ubiquinone oxidoreductase subunit F (NADH-binding)
MSIDILKKIASAGLVGRGGASFPTAQKWAAVKDALKTKKLGYIIINGAEGEPGVKKDGYIIANYPEEVLNGVYAADQFLGSVKIKRIYFFLNHEYYQKYSAGLKKILANKKYSALAKKLEFFLKPNNLAYIGGEETALLNLIEGKKIQPRLKPPYPTASGLHNHPTLINNTETFYNVSRVLRGQYEEDRFYTITGGVKRPGVYKLPINLTIEEVLKRTGNYPAWPFFVQSGGEASGEVFNSDQLDQPVAGAGSIMIYHEEETDRRKLLKYWLKFYQNQSCGQCTPCREGTYRLWEIINKKEIDYKLFWEIVLSLEETSFCGLGSSLPVPLKSYFNNIVKTVKK